MNLKAILIWSSSIALFWGTTQMHARCPLTLHVSLAAESSYSQIKIEEVRVKKGIGPWARLRNCEGLTVTRGNSMSQACKLKLNCMGMRDYRVRYSFQSEAGTGSAWTTTKALIWNKDRKAASCSIQIK